MPTYLGTVGATPPPPPRGGSPMIPCAPHVVKTFFKKLFFFFLLFFLASTLFSLYSLRMNSMIDPQNEVASLATIAPEEFYGAYNGNNDDDGPTCDDVADDAHQYVDDVY